MEQVARALGEVFLRGLGVLRLVENGTKVLHPIFAIFAPIFALVEPDFWAAFHGSGVDLNLRISTR